MPTIRGWAQHLHPRRAVPRTLNRANFLSLVSSLFSRLRLGDGPAVFVLLLIVLAPLACHQADPSEDPGSLVIYAAREEQLVGPVVERFREEAGVRVEVKYGGTAQVAATLLEEGDASPRRPVLDARSRRAGRPFRQAQVSAVGHSGLSARQSPLFRRPMGGHHRPGACAGLQP